VKSVIYTADNAASSADVSTCAAPEEELRASGLRVGAPRATLKGARIDHMTVRRKRKRSRWGGISVEHFCAFQGPGEIHIFDAVFTAEVPISWWFHTHHLLKFSIQDSEREIERSMRRNTGDKTWPAIPFRLFFDLSRLRFIYSFSAAVFFCNIQYYYLHLNLHLHLHFFCNRFSAETAVHLQFFCNSVRWILRDNISSVASLLFNLWQINCRLRSRPAAFFSRFSIILHT
jgi:hypothetical protein